MDLVITTVDGAVWLEVGNDDWQPVVPRDARHDGFIRGVRGEWRLDEDRLVTIMRR